MRAGEVSSSESLDQIRERATAQLALLPEPLRRPGTGGAAPYPVRYSDRLKATVRSD